MSLVDALTRDEGDEPNPYQCTAGAWTIGRGRNLEAQPLTGGEWKTLLDAGEISVTLSPAGSERLLRNGIASVQIQCATTFTWWHRLDEARRDVVANMVYNLGLPRLLGFKHMLAAIAAGDYGLAADELLDSRYARQVGQRAQRLAIQLRTGVRQ
jgi:lysozyme